MVDKDAVSKPAEKDPAQWVTGGEPAPGEPSGTAPSTAGGTSTRESFEPPRPTGRWSLAADTGRRYAAVSGDVNTIHLSGLSAKAFGFPSAIAHGMYTMALAGRAVTACSPVAIGPPRAPHRGGSPHNALAQPEASSIC